MTFEVEQKYHVEDLAELESGLRDMAAVEGKPQHQSDTYFNHPCRDFHETKEAFRVRRVDGVPMVTFKGAKLPGKIKARRELEWRLDPGDSDGSKMEELLELLSFRRVAVVEKRRRNFSVTMEGTEIGIAIDEVGSLGWFAEIEVIVDESAEVEDARSQIGKLGERLGLRRPEERSYLTMLLEMRSPG